MITEEGDKSKTTNDATTNTFRSECDAQSIESLKETVICHEAQVYDKDDEIGRALRLGCHIALTTRRAVFDRLGFTMSAGVSTNKLVSKLGASYGKPNGQVRESGVMMQLRAVSSWKLIVYFIFWHRLSFIPVQCRRSWRAHSFGKLGCWEANLESECLRCCQKTKQRWDP